MIMGARILVCDDDAGMRESLEAVLTDDGYEVCTAADGAGALARLHKQQFKVMLLDLRMPDANGIELLSRIKQLAPDTAVIIMTAYGTIKNAVEAVRQGAFDFITKPFELEDVRSTIKKAVQMQELTEENKELRRMLRENVVLKDIIGSSTQMQAVFEIIRKVVNYDVTILIGGQSGTGKELVAEAIHYNSARRNKPFIKLNCAVLPETLLESELFGYEKGAFTGATASKPGRFELAEGGTLFLDEIGDTSLAMQSKLLRVLEEKEFERVGGRVTLKSDVRVLAATNKDLRKEVETKRFREDLYHRLNVVSVYLPSLRERAEDIPLLVNHFLKELNLLFQKNFISVSPEAMQCLLDYSWPGNIRELKNMLQKAVLLAEGNMLMIDHLPEEIRKFAAVPALAHGEANAGVTLDEMERNHILRVLREAGWNQTKASEILQIHRNTLREKIRKFNLKEGEN
jgi:two-component system, NtrC family, response regulator AtoC